MLCWFKFCWGHVSYYAKKFFILTVALALLGCSTIDNDKKSPPQNFKKIIDINITLEPGVWHGFRLAPSSENNLYFEDLTPQEPSKINGAHIEKSTIQPEFDGREWNDVLRISIPKNDNPLPINIRVYRLQLGDENNEMFLFQTP